MLVLKGQLRQVGSIKTKDGDELTKLWVEHESPGWDEGINDIKIIEFMLPSGEVPKELKAGDSVSLQVRAYSRGREIAYKALSLIADSLSIPRTGKATPAA